MIIEYQLPNDSKWMQLNFRNCNSSWFRGISAIMEERYEIVIEGVKYRRQSVKPEPLPNLTFDITIKNKYGNIIHKQIDIPLTI